jgi:hypothetical protein
MVFIGVGYIVLIVEPCGIDNPSKSQSVEKPQVWFWGKSPLRVVQNCSVYRVFFVRDCALFQFDC